MKAPFIKKAAGFFAGLGFFLFALLLSFSLALNTDNARQLIFNQLNALLPGTIFVDHLSVSLFSGTLDVRGLGLDDPGGNALVRVKRLYADISLFSLVMRTLSIEEALIEDPHVFFTMDEKGRLNFEKAFGIDDVGVSSHEQPGFEIPWNLKVAALDLTGGELTYSMPLNDVLHAENIDVHAEDVNLLRESGQCSIKLGPFHIGLNGQTILLNSLEASGRFAKNRLSPLLLHVKSDMGELDAKGNIDALLSHPILDLSLVLNSSLEPIDKIFDLSLGLKGKVHLEMDLKGEIENPNVDLRLMAGDLNILGQPLNTVDILATLRDRQVDISRFHGDTGAGIFDISGNINLEKAFALGFVSSQIMAEEIRYTLNLDTVLDQIPEIAELEGIVTGPVAGRIELEGQGIFPEQMNATAEIAADSNRLSLLDSPESAYHLTGTVLFENMVLRVLSSRLENRGNRLSLKGDYNINKQTWKGDLDLNADKLSNLSLISPYGSFKGRLDINSNWSGLGDTWNVIFKAQGNTLFADDIPLGDLTLDAGLGDSGILTIPNLTLKQGKSRLNGKGTLGAFDEKQALDLSLAFTQIDIPHLFKQDQITALADGHLHIGGNINMPLMELQMTGKDLSWEQVELGTLSLKASYDHGRVIIPDLTLLNKQSGLNINGELQLFEPVGFTFLDRPSGDISITGKYLFLQDFYPDFKGELMLDAHVKGQVGDLDGGILMDGKALELGVQTVDRVLIKAHLDKGDLIFDHGAMTLKPEEEIHLGGKISLLDNQYDLHLDSTGISVKHLGPLGQQTFCEGKVILNLEGKGNLDNPSMTGNVVLSDFSLNKELIDKSSMSLDLSDRVARVSGKLIMDIDTQFHLDTYDFKAMARFDKAELAPFFRIAGYGDLTGEATGLIQGEGNVGDPETIQVTADVSWLTVRSKDVALIQSDSIHVDYKNNTFDFPETHFTLLDKGELIVKGSGQRDKDFDVTAHGTIPLEVLDVFVEDLTFMSGQIRVAASLNGSVDDPDLQGEVALESVSFQIPEFMQTVHDVNGTIRVTPQELTLTGLTGGLDSGRFEIQGSLGLEHLEPGALSLEIKGDALPFSMPDMLDMSVNTRMTITGTPDQAMLEGTLMLLEGKYYKDVSMNLISMVGEKTREEMPEKSLITAPYLRGMGLDLRLRHRNPFEVDNNMALLELKPDLRLHGTLNNPLLSGRAQVVSEGVISYQGKDFEVTKGVMDFLNPYKIEPTLDVECQTEIRTWTLILAVAGTPDNLKFTLTSNPSEADADILSLLIFGKTTHEMKEGGGNSSVSAAQLLADTISRNLAKNIKDATGMDLVEVDYDNGGTQGTENGVKVTIGKELSDRLTIKYGVESKDAETVQRAVSEYKFLENLMINAYQDTGNNYGAELVYRLEFR
ncbi:MAG: translocation/assembly module TamB domain-containing protein [Proteobacteria bacterium]|nr:translocation/assembly module TamB domain-containing protein [Pseudomonadota bacterium]